MEALGFESGGNLAVYRHLTHYIRSTRKRGVAVVPRLTSFNTGSCVKLERRVLKPVLRVSLGFVNRPHVLGKKMEDLKGQRRLLIADQ